MKVSNFCAAETTLLFASEHSNKNSDIEISLKTEKRFNVFTVSTGRCTHCEEQNPQGILNDV